MAELQRHKKKQDGQRRRQRRRRLRGGHLMQKGTERGQLRRRQTRHEHKQ
jgi:hypothetical protein